MKIIKNFSWFVHPLHKAFAWNEEVSCRSRTTMAKKCTKKRDARAKPLSLLKLPIALIQKFRYHGNLTSHLSCLLDIFFVPSKSPGRLCESLLGPVPFSNDRYLVTLTFLFLLDAEFILPTALWFIQGRGGTTSGPNHPHIWRFWNLSQQVQWWSMLLIKTWLSWAKRSKKVQQKRPSVFIFPFTIFPSLSRPFLCPPRRLQNVRLSI